MSDDPTPTFTVEYGLTATFRTGWGVAVTPVWDVDDATGHEWISDIDVDVVAITAETVRHVIGGVPCVLVGETYVPAKNFAPVDDLDVGDTHDLRYRWFATEEEACAHAESVEKTWANPAPWQSFVQL